MFLPSNITLQFGDSGDFVSELQRRLATVKCFAEDMVNGFYDGNTVNGVTRFQAMIGLHADGVAGPETLRRLNGTIAGGGSANTDKKEEEKGPTQAQKAVFFGLQEQQQQDPTVWGAQQNPEQQHAPQRPAAELPAMQPLKSDLQPQEQLKQAEQQSRPPLDPSLAAAFLDQPQQRPEMPLRDGVQERPLANDTLMGDRDKQLAQQPQQTEPKQEPKGFLGRAMQFASEGLQRLANYFESKLSPSVLSEVRDIGSIMARSGMREAPIPTGPEMGQAPATPARGPEQVQRS